MLTATDGATGGAEDPQDRADQYEHAADGREEGHSDQYADDKQNHTKENHDASNLEVQAVRFVQYALRVTPRSPTKPAWSVGFRNRPPEVSGLLAEVLRPVLSMGGAALHHVADAHVRE